MITRDSRRGRQRMKVGGINSFKSVTKARTSQPVNNCAAEAALFAEISSNPTKLREPAFSPSLPAHEGLFEPLMLCEAASVAQHQS